MVHLGGHNHAIAQQLIEQIKPLHLNIKVSIIILKDNGYEELFFNQRY